MSNKGVLRNIPCRVDHKSAEWGRFDDKDLTAVKDTLSLRFLQLSSNTRAAINGSRRSS